MCSEVNNYYILCSVIWVIQIATSNTVNSVTMDSPDLTRWLSRVGAHGDVDSETPSTNAWKGCVMCEGGMCEVCVWEDGVYGTLKLLKSSS